jgi:copper(I)-binding protein
MKRLVVATFLLVMFLPHITLAHEIKVGDLVIVHPMVGETKKGQVSAEGSVSIRNEGKTQDQLLSVKAEFAETTMVGPPVPVQLPANGKTVSIPLAFKGIQQKLSEDEAYAGEFVFQNAGTVRVDLMVHSHPH